MKIYTTGEEIILTVLTVIILAWLISMFVFSVKELIGETRKAKEGQRKTFYDSLKNNTNNKNQ